MTVGQRESGDAVLAVDLGTSRCKALLVDVSGRVVGHAAREYPLRAPAPGLAEQDPEQVLAAAEAAVRELVDAKLAKLRAVALGSAMHSVVAVEGDDRPLTPLLTWADRRGGEQAARLRERGLGESLTAVTGTPVHASSPLCKLLWLRENDPQTFGRAAAFLSMKELLLRRWCGAALVDASVASSSGLFNLQSRDWEPQALELLGIESDRLSTIVPTDHVIAGMRQDVASRLGLAADVPLVVGATDGPLANLGVGALQPDVAAVTIGTSAAVRVTVESCGAPAGSGLFCYVLDRRRWVVGGAVNNAGLVLDWLGAQLFPDVGDPIACALAEAAQSPPGARGVVCEPRLAGERFPDYADTVGGAFSNLSLAHTRSDLLRAALEGIVRPVAGIVAALRSEVGPMTELRGGGGMLTSPLVAQMLADMSGCPVAIGESVESSALGAARLAWEALGSALDQGGVADAGSRAVYRPDPGVAARYDRPSSS